jgi:hypothetical protein
LACHPSRGSNGPMPRFREPATPEKPSLPNAP